jgi:hypothetical protein
MSELGRILGHAEEELRQWPGGSEQSYLASLWRELLVLRDRAALAGTDDGHLIGPAMALAGRAAIGPSQPADPGGPGGADGADGAGRPGGAGRVGAVWSAARVPAAALAATVRRATLAPTLHDGQPWRFAVQPDGVEVLLDTNRPSPTDTPGGVAGRSGRIACGAAAYNLRLAFAVELGRQADTAVLPDRDRPALIARVRAAAPRAATFRERELYRAIPRRHGGTVPFRDDLVVGYPERSALQTAAHAEGCWLELVTEPARRAAIGELSRRAERAPATAGADFAADPVLAVLGGPGGLPRDQVAVGQALQRTLLTATDAGLAVAVYSRPLEVPATREELRHLIGGLGTPYLLLRMGYPASRPTATRSTAGRAGGHRS